MSDLLRITLIPPQKSPKPSYRFSHNPSREWVATFTEHLTELEYQYAKSKYSKFWATLFVWPRNLKLREINSNYIHQSDFNGGGFRINHIRNQVMELECKWNELLGLHDVILKAVELANKDVPDSVYTPGHNGSSNQQDIYNYLINRN